MKPFKHSLRILLKYGQYTGFALVGLSVALTSVWFIADYVGASYEYDRFHSNHDRIYRLTMDVAAGGNTDSYATTGKPLGEYLTKNYPGIETYAKLKFQQSTVRVNDQSFMELGLFQANPEILSVFSFNFLGGGERSLLEPNTAILSKSLAEKYFDSIDVIGTQIQVNDHIYTITGVFEDWPENSHLKLNGLLSLEENTEYNVQSWFDLEHYTYVLVDHTTDQQDLNTKLDHLAAEHLLPMLEGSGLGIEFHAQPLKQVYFSPGQVDDVKKGSLNYTNLLAVTGILILIIASLNCINLTLTRSTYRSKEILLKKILGISRKQLLLQNALESFLVTLMVLLLAAVLVILCEGFYMDNTGFSSLKLSENWWHIIIYTSLIFTVSLLGSSYSGVYLSFSNNSMAPEGPRITFLKKMLLGFQYAIAAIILIITLAMNRQLGFIKHKDLGFTKEHVLIVTLPEDDPIKDKTLQFRKYLQDITPVQNASLVGSGALPGEQNGKDVFKVNIAGISTEKVFNIYRIDEYYFDLLDIKMVTGRNFNPDKLSDKTGSVIINETLAKSLNWDQPLGNKMWYGGEMKQVIGVVSNFHNKSLHNLIEPIVFQYETSYATKILLKTRSSDIDIIKSAWNRFYPDSPFSLTYFDQFIEALYQKEHQLAQVFGFFSLVSMMLCAMGLFALFSLHVLQKTKEMSIRKVLGANYSNLLQSITKHYSTVAILSISTAIPISWYVLTRWQSEFSYKVPLGFGVYFFPGLILLSASLVVIAYHLVKLLHINPVDALKNE